MIVTFTKARVQDAKALALVSWQAFDHDVHYGARQKGGPPGYRSEGWHKKVMRSAHVYKITHELRVIGGLVIFPQQHGRYELGRIFIHPDYQNQGVGAQAIHFLEETYPHARQWTLGTPEWNGRNRHFYEKMGYVLIGRDRDGGLRYGKLMKSKVSK